MKKFNFIRLAIAVLFLSACNNDQGIVKNTANDVARGVENLVEGVKQMPDAISKAARKVQQDTGGEK